MAIFIAGVLPARAQTPTTTVLEVSPALSTFGRAVDLTAIVSDVSATGKVTFYAGTTVLGTRSLAGGAAALETILLPTGASELRARYLGDGARAPSTSPVVPHTVVVTAADGLAPPVVYGGMNDPRAIAVADFNNDGVEDAIVADNLLNAVHVLLGNPDGTFQAPLLAPASTQPQGVAVGDLNEDGNTDAVLPSLLSFFTDVSVLLGNGNGTFGPASQYASGGPTTRDVGVGDLNRDGHLDVIAINNGGGSLGVLLGNGDGTLQAPVLYSVGVGPRRVAVADFNRDGHADLATAASIDGNAVVLLNDGSGAFPTITPFPAGGQPVDVAAADFNDDGHVDLVLGINGTSVSVLLNDGTGTFQPPVNYPATTFVRAVGVADLNGDGHQDVFASGDDGLGLLYGNGDGTLAPAVHYDSTSGATHTAVGDFNGDGRVDLVSAVFTGAINVALALPPIAPATTIVLTPPAQNGANGWYVSMPHVTVSADTAGGPAVTETRCALDPAAVPASFADLPAGCAFVGAGGDLTADGSHTLYAASMNASDTAGPVVSATVQLDRTSPAPAITLAPAAPTGANGWYVSPPHITVSATDASGGSGLAETRCALDPVSAPVAFADLPAGCAFTGAGADVTTDGMHVAYVASSDSAGNTSAVMASAPTLVDLTPPSITCDTPAPTFTVGQADAVVTASVSDSASGPVAAGVSAAADTSSDGTRTVTLTGADLAGQSASVSCAYTVNREVDPTDRDGDGLTNDEEIRFGLDPDDPTGENGADGDPDHDGLTNQQEIDSHPQSHPRGFFAQHFAEGATGFFQTNIGILNASQTDEGHVLATLLSEAPGTTVTLPFTLGPLQRRSMDINAELGGAGAGLGVSTRVESDQPLAAMRDMRWDAAAYGSTLERGAPAASTTWYFAEGATGTFRMYLLIENPNATPATVTIDYLRSMGGAIAETVVVPAFARRTIDVNGVPGVEDAHVAAALSSDVPIVAERAMYASFSDRFFDAGTAGLGVTTLGTSWHFAEGATGFFDTFLLFGNPGDSDANVSVAYRLPDGTTIAKSHLVRARSRLTLQVAGEDPMLASALFSIAVTSDRPLVAERALWWGLPWYEGDVSQGTMETGAVWAIGEAAEGGPASESTFVLVSNGSANAGQVRLTVLHDDGTTEQKAYALPGNARLTIRVLDDFASTIDHRFSLLVESLGEGGGDGVPLTVECARYQSASGRFGEAGGVALATRIR